jgi:carbonic anhydrase
MLSFLGLCLFAAGSFGQTTWNYDRCSPFGPAGWEGKCQAQNQLEGTPINLCGAVGFTAPTISLSSSYSDQRYLKIKNPGYTIEVGIIDNAPTLQAGSLSNLVGRSTNSSTHIWTLAQMHMHWGRTGQKNEGSEHYMQGQRYPLEAHFVHYNSLYGNLSASVSKSDGLLVVGVFFDVGATDLASMKLIADNIGIADKSGVKLPSTMQLTEFFSPTGNFYSYAGGLTTPTCNEAVTWIVMKDVKTITQDSLAKFWAAKASNGTISNYGNYRPLQAIGSRTVYSSNGNTAACTAVTDPTFICASAGLMASPSFFHAAVVVLLLAVRPF